MIQEIYCNDAHAAYELANCFNLNVKGIYIVEVASTVNGFIVRVFWNCGPVRDGV